MHSTIYQLSKTPVEPEDVLDAEQVYTKAVSSFGDLIASCRQHPETTEKMAQFLASCFPEDMFAYHPGDASIIYNGGYEDWKLEHVHNIQAIARNLSIESYDKMGLYNLKQAIDKSCFGNLIFMMTNVNLGYIRNPFYGVELMDEYVKRLNIGDKLYVVSVFDYKF